MTAITSNESLTSLMQYKNDPNTHIVKLALSRGTGCIVAAASQVHDLRKAMANVHMHRSPSAFV